jgi:hypothetical protein
MGGVLELFCKEVAGVYFARYVRDFNCVVLYIFADSGLVEVEMFGALVCEGNGPIDRRLVVVVNSGAFVAIREMEISCKMTDAEELDDACVRGGDLGFTRAARCLVLPDGFPCDGPP